MAVCGPKLFNVLPKDIRNLMDCTVEKFKSKLDEFLLTVQDQPALPGYTGGSSQQFGSNSLLDILAHSNY